MSLQVWLPLNGDLHNQGLKGDTIITNTNAVINNEGKIGKCYSFGTATSRINLSANAMSSFTGEASFCFWIKILSWNTSYATYFQAGMGSTPWAHYIFGFLRNNANSSCCFTISNGTTASNASYLTPNLELNTWYHIGLVYKTGHCLIYINGILYKDYTTSIVPDFSKITTITLGACNNGTGYQTNCLMNDVRIYDHALSDKEVQEIAKGLAIHIKLDDNFLTDNSGYNYPLVLSNVSNTEDTPRYTQSTTFSGTTSYIKINTNSCMAQHAEAMTINLWAKNNTWATNTHFFSCTESGGFNTEPGNSGYLRFPVYVCTNAEKTTYAYKYDSKELQISAIPVNEWVMLTWVYDNTGTRTYINGQLHHTYTNTSYGIRFNMNARLFLGCEAGGANPTSPYYNGQESDFRLYYTALTEDQILELYNTSMSIDDKGNGYAREMVEDSSLNITKTGQFHGNELIDDNTFTTASITKNDRQLKVNTFYEY